MTEQNKEIHHQTKKGADLALAKKQISRASYDAVLAGTLSLAEAKALGRDRGPDTAQASGGRRTPTGTPGRATGERPQDSPDTPPRPISRTSKDDTLSPCLCGCGELVTRRFKAGHDMRMVSLAKAHLRGEAEPTKEQLAYLEETGKLERARQQLEKEERKRQEKIAAKKSERQREGEAEAKKRNAK